MHIGRYVFEYGFHAQPQNKLLFLQNYSDAKIQIKDWRLGEVVNQFHVVKMAKKNGYLIGGT